MLTREYIEYLRFINRRREPAWMDGYVQMPEIDSPTFEEWQDRENHRNPKGLMSRLRRLIR